MHDIKNAEATDVLLTQLASILSKNLITNSFPIGQAQQPISIMLKNGEVIKEERSRNILVIGAGASHNTSSKILLAKNAFDEVKAALCKEYGDKIVNFINKKLKELSQVYKLNETDFETQLLACSVIDKDIVLEQLKKLYNHKYPVSLFYEIVAHLFKHRFIDVIINFNFDEMLDNAIEEEMSDTQYRNIFSDGHCFENMSDMLYNKRLAFPIYIKPHGTISHPSTLRFTRQAYYDMPLKIKETIIYLVKGETENKAQPQLPVNLIVAGFGLKSHEFNAILSDNLEKERASLFYFDMYDNKEDFWERRFKNDSLDLFTCENSTLFPLLHTEYGNRSLDNWFYLLWNRIQERFNTIYQPKGIARHVIIDSIFKPMVNKLIDRTYQKAKYFRDRTIIELAIDIFSSSDGLINLRQLKESRVHKYFSLYKEEDKDAPELFELLDKFKLKKYKDYIKDTWCFDKDNLNYIRDLRQLIHDNVSRDLKNDVIGVLKDSAFNGKSNPLLDEHISKLANSKKLFLNLRFAAKDNHVSIFPGITNDDVINTDIKWIYTFQKYFVLPEENTKWNLILSISETGGIFSTPGVIENLYQKKIMLICSYSSYKVPVDIISPKNYKREKLLTEKLKNIKHHIVSSAGVPELRMLPFRNHNQHMILFTKVDKVKKDIEFVGGLYYGRRNMSKRVTPIHVQHPNDLNELFSVFVNYWERACKEDDIDMIKDAVINNNITPAIQGLATKATSKSFSEIKSEIIATYIADTDGL
ncbi:MAG TPA: SIR2 family protein [Flavitalea sp.]|nr:SIR2 family protein [Flavitalea sp.]